MTWRSSKKNGSMIRYLKMFDFHASYPGFAGPNAFNYFRTNDFLVPEETYVRVTFGGIEHMHYYVTNGFQLEGAQGLPDGNGTPGVHDPEVLLRDDDNTFWEIHDLNRDELKKLGIF
ncbi:MAG: hypothetical protein ABIA21_00110 [Candidatus Aenigmatarchaeota archaeon]